MGDLLGKEGAALCANFLGCKKYILSYKAGSKICSGCFAEITAHTAISRLIDDALDPVLGATNSNSPQVIMDRFVDAVVQIREQFAEEGYDDITPSEVGSLVTHRILKRLADMENQVRLAAYHN